MHWQYAITYIEDIIIYSDELTIPVFQLKDLTELYKKQMTLHGTATKDTKYLHATRFKNQIIENVLCLCKTKKGKFTLFTLDSEMGRALFEACQSSSHNDGMIIVKAASVIRKQLFNNDEIFNGDLSKKQRMASISQVLHQLIQLLLEIGTCNDNNYSTCSSNIANNISQLIRYKVVKYQRRDTVTYVRHSSSNVLPLLVAVGLMLYMRTLKKSLVNQLAHEGLSISYKRTKSIQRCINNQLCSKYLAEDIACPPKLQTGLFTSQLTTLTIINLQLPQQFLFTELL